MVNFFGRGGTLYKAGHVPSSKMPLIRSKRISIWQTHVPFEFFSNLFDPLFFCRISLFQMAFSTGTEHFGSCGPKTSEKASNH